MKIIIAIDGYSSCGKSTLAKQLAAQLQYTYIDSGAMYRAITLYFLRNNVNFENISAVNDALKNIHITFETNALTGKSDIYLNGENVERYIRDMLVADKVSPVAAIKEVRAFAVAQQQKLGKKRGIVMDGRDIGTVVFPDAELKIFMTADPAVRVKRRFLELEEKGEPINIEDVKSNLEMRDYIDTNREESPLKQAADARIIDNSDLNEDQQLRLAMQWVHEALQTTAT